MPLEIHSLKQSLQLIDLVLKPILNIFSYKKQLWILWQSNCTKQWLNLIAA